MKEPKFNSNVDNIYNSLSNIQKEEYKSKQEKISKSSLIFGIIFIPIAIGLLIFCLVTCVQEQMFSLLIFAIVIVVIVGAIIWWTITTSLIGLKGSDEIKIKLYIKRLENQKNAQRKDLAKGTVLGRFPVENINTVTILDSYTEYSDKLHAVLNYQEIIQTRVYKFKVDYKDGTSQIITTTENSKEYNILVPYINKNTYTQANSSSNNIDKLRKYKQLLDDGIITQEEFDAKKKELL